MENITSKDAYNMLQDEKNTYLIDVRTEKEHLTVGVPDLRGLKKEVVLIEWKSSFFQNTKKLFLSDFNKVFNIGQEGFYIFICRSGIRSSFAALTVEESFDFGHYKYGCFNVVDGFEGNDVSSLSQSPNGWKNSGLPWR